MSLTTDYDDSLKNIHHIWLRIRLTPGMEMLAQEIGNGRKPYTQDWETPVNGSPYVQPPLVYSPVSPTFSPFSPSVPTSLTPVTRKRSGHWNLDATSSFPALFLPEASVLFYSNMGELNQALKAQKPGDLEKIIINMANVVCVERIVVRRSYAQNIRYHDVAAGIRLKEPPLTVTPLTLVEPQTIPDITNPWDELFFKVVADGGVGPYRYFMTGQPSDLYITEDGWVRGYIEEDQWPLTDFRQFSIVILVEDSSVPKQTAGIELRYRLYPHL